MLPHASVEGSGSGESSAARNSRSASSSLPSPIPADCGSTAATPSQTIAGADGRNYRVDTYIFPSLTNGGGWTKQVTVVIRDSNDNTRILARETSTFDPSTAP